MSQISNPINAPTPAQHRLHSRGIEAGIKPFAQGKVDTSAVPQNQVEATWQDALDLVNPLQQIPLVGDVYRSVTGEKISGLARVAGGFLWGGLTGGFVAAFTAAYAETHDDQGPGEQAVAALLGTDKGTPVPPAAPVMLAEARPPSAAAPKDSAALAPLQLAALSTPGSAAPEARISVAASTQSTAVGPTLAPSAPQAGQPVFAASLPSEALQALAQRAAAGKNQSSSDQAMTVQTASIAPLRDRLNHKRPTTLSTTPKPLDQYTTLPIDGAGGGNFIARLPPPGAGRIAAGTAVAAAAQAQNLQLLQGAINTAGTEMPPAALSPAMPPLPDPVDPDLASTATGTLTHPVASGQHNPLPLQLVQDMMLQALDKYKAMQAVTPMNGP